MSTPYQLTPEASKGNAFCWMSWHSDLARSVASEGKNPPRDDSKAGRLRAALEPGPQTPATLAEIADVKHPYMVASLLKHDIAAGRVVKRGGKYWLNLN
jgi:hypothetical protein